MTCRAAKYLKQKRKHSVIRNYKVTTWSKPNGWIMTFRRKAKGVWRYVDDIHGRPISEILNASKR